MHAGEIMRERGGWCRSLLEHNKEEENKGWAEGVCGDELQEVEVTGKKRAGQSVKEYSKGGLMREVRVAGQRCRKMHVGEWRCYQLHAIHHFCCRFLRGSYSTKQCVHITCSADFIIAPACASVCCVLLYQLTTPMSLFSSHLVLLHDENDCDSSLFSPPQQQ